MPNLFKIYQQMGWQYFWFRIQYEIKKKNGFLKLKFPTSLPQIIIPKRINWQFLPFVFVAKMQLQVKKRQDEALKNRVEAFLKNQLVEYFNNPDLAFSEQNWHKNSQNGFVFDSKKHWTAINDFSAETGDIKFVWEKARFNYLQDLIRYDFHFEQDCSQIVFQEIDSWINANPLNLGVHYCCGQEISFRVLNWIFALYYFQDDVQENLFQKIIQSIYEQTHRVSENHVFAQKAVKNNHVVSEAICLYTVGLLFPFLPDAEKWKKQGRLSLEQAIDYQFFNDGSYIQYSMNYHRLAIQLLTYASKLADLHKEPFGVLVKYKLFSSAQFLMTCQDSFSGHLPNYGANDGTLFLRLTDADYRDFSPTLLSLIHYLGYTTYFDDDQYQEEAEWLGNEVKKLAKTFPIPQIAAFNTGGYFVLRDDKSLTFIRCGKHDFRPSQADNLHLDIWVEGENILRDAGSYIYNDALNAFFVGTQAHNTVMLGENNQMQKANRFLWYNWTQATQGKWIETDKSFIFEGETLGFEQIKKDIKHQRKVLKHAGKLVWEITDKIEHQTQLSMKQTWNISDDFFEKFQIKAFDENAQELLPIFLNYWFSGTYGTKMKSQQIIFETKTKQIYTVINFLGNPA